VFSASALLADLEVQAVGMMRASDGPDESVYFFNHNCPGCGTSFTVSILDFAEFIVEEMPEANLDGTPACKGHCNRIADLSLCNAPCSNAPYRRFLVNVLINKSARHELVVLGAATDGRKSTKVGK
jgi:hypothetical protein